MRIDFANELQMEPTVRDRMVAGSFDVPYVGQHRVAFDFDAPIESREWSIGAIVGPSGCGKSSVLRRYFGQAIEHEWDPSKSVVSNIDATVSDITAAFSSVGFNTIPAWLRPFHVLSNGEQFRVTLARALIEAAKTDAPIIIDEFTSVVDRQVAKIGAHAVQKFVRKTNRKMVVASCHYDIEEWLQPDWVIEPALQALRWRSVQRRPTIDVEIRRAPRSIWSVFAPYHYLTADLHNGAQCFVAYVGGRPAAFAGCLYRPHAIADNIAGVSRLVTLPDFQGLGLALCLVDVVASAYAAIGMRLRTYPAHAALIRSFDRTPRWSMCKKAGTFASRSGSTAKVLGAKTAIVQAGYQGRPCAVFEYIGDAMPEQDARRLLQSSTYGR